MTWTTIKYRLEACSIEQYPRCFREVWFLDAVQVNAEGRTSTSNICSGTKEYCLETMAVVVLVDM